MLPSVGPVADSIYLFYMIIYPMSNLELTYLSVKLDCMYRIPPIWWYPLLIVRDALCEEKYYVLKGIRHRSRGSDNTPPGSSAGGSYRRCCPRWCKLFRFPPFPRCPHGRHFHPVHLHHPSQRR